MRLDLGVDVSFYDSLRNSLWEGLGGSLGGSLRVSLWRNLGEAFYEA